MTRISQQSVDAMKPSDKDAYLWDEEKKGFGLKVTPMGRKVYFVQYRLGGRKGRTRRVTIGAHGTVTAKEARDEAKRLLGIVASGKDPAEERDAKRAQEPVKTLIKQFLTEHVDSKLKPSTAAEYHRLSKLYITKSLKHRPIGEVKRADVARLHHSMKDKPYQANRVLAFLSKFFNWCEKHGLRPDGSNPCRHVEKYPERKRERFLSQAELAELGKALRAAEADKSATEYSVAAIRLLILTGARLNEILTLKWEHVDFERACLRLPDSKTGQKTVYLNAPALEVLSNLSRIEDNPFVICGEVEGAHLVNLQKPWRRIRKKAKLEDVRLHDLRHSFASVAAAGGMSLPLIGALLGHTQTQTTARYAHLSADPLKAASDAIASSISVALGDGRPRQKKRAAGKK